MNKSRQITLLIGWSFLLPLGTHAQGSPEQGLIIDGFPGYCSEASTQVPLDGHVVRVGTVGWTHHGWSFFFPDRADSQNLQRVAVAENVGRIGQSPDEDLSQIIRERTPDGSFLVAQIFVGDPNMEPVVTCLSPLIPVNQFVPSQYLGHGWEWLNRGVFYERLRWKKYAKWNWRKWWGPRYFDNARHKFNRFRDAGGLRKFRKFRRDRDIHRDGRRDATRKPFDRDIHRDGRRDATRKPFDRDDQRGRVRIQPIGEHRHDAHVRKPILDRRRDDGDGMRKIQPMDRTVGDRLGPVRLQKPSPQGGLDRSRGFKALKRDEDDDDTPQRGRRRGNR